ncbi:flavin reductase, partial [Mesorhizobium sp. M7A.F.Ca.CA.004.04.1.1]
MTEPTTSEANPVGVADFRAAMRLIVGNVSVITAGTGEDRSG